MKTADFEKVMRDAVSEFMLTAWHPRLDGDEDALTLIAWVWWRRAYGKTFDLRR